VGSPDRVDEASPACDEPRLIRRLYTTAGAAPPRERHEPTVGCCGGLAQDGRQGERAVRRQRLVVEEADRARVHFAETKTESSVGVLRPRTEPVYLQGQME